MNELVKIESNYVGGEAVPTFNARDLHAFLGSKENFGNWISYQLERARLVENRDFVINKVFPINGGAGRPRLEYHLTLEAGKHIAMMSNCQKGFEVRDYFIECERRAKAPMVQLPHDYLSALEV